MWKLPGNQVRELPGYQVSMEGAPPAQEGGADVVVVMSLL